MHVLSRGTAWIRCALYGLCTISAQQVCNLINRAICCRQADPMEMPSDDDESASEKSGSEFEEPAPSRSKAKRKPAAKGTRHASDYDLANL